jgi:hypothetical protein
VFNNNMLLQAGSGSGLSCYKIVDKHLMLLLPPPPAPTATILLLRRRIAITKGPAMGDG